MEWPAWTTLEHGGHGAKTDYVGGAVRGCSPEAAWSLTERGAHGGARRGCSGTRGPGPKAWGAVWPWEPVGGPSDLLQGRLGGRPQILLCLLVGGGTCSGVSVLLSNPNLTHI